MLCAYDIGRGVAISVQTVNAGKLQLPQPKIIEEVKFYNDQKLIAIMAQAYSHINFMHIRKKKFLNVYTKKCNCKGYNIVCPY